MSFYDDQPNLYKIVKYIVNNCEKISTRNLHYLLFISDLEYSTLDNGNSYTEGKYIRCNNGVIHNRLNSCLAYMGGIEIIVEDTACFNVSSKLYTRWPINNVDKKFIEILNNNMLKFGYKRNNFPILKHAIYNLSCVSHSNLGDILLSDRLSK